MKSYKNHNYAGLSKIRLFNSYQNLAATEVNGDWTTRPEDAEVLKTLEIPSGTLDVYKLKPNLESMVEYYAMAEDTDFKAEEKSILNRVEVLEEKLEIAKSESSKESFEAKRLKERIKRLNDPEQGLLAIVATFAKIGFLHNSFFGSQNLTSILLKRFP